MDFTVYFTVLFFILIQPIVNEQQLDSLEESKAANNQSCKSLQFNLPKSARPTHIIHYSDNFCKASVLRCYCLTTTNTTSDDYALGHCLEGCFITDKFSEYYMVSLIGNESLCAPYHRTGTLCGTCVNGYGPPVYSFSLRCVKCPNKGFWGRLLRYVLVAYGPLTIFLVIIVIFTISTNSAPLHGWILVSQIFSCSLYMRTLTRMAELQHIDQYAYRILGSVCGVWNLDFFRTVYKPFCLHSNLATFQALSLDFLIAAYPLAVIVLLYTIVELYSRGYILVIICFQPFVNCCIRFRHQLNIRTSLVDAFGTFFSLSYLKLFSTIADLLTTTKVWENGKTAASYNLYFDGETQFFRDKHIPFAILSFAVLLLFNLLPLVLLLLYSFPKMQFIIQWLPVSLQNILFPFLDNILSCYKDGTNGTKNCRYFAVVYHISRTAFLSIAMWTHGPFVFPMLTIAVMVTGMLVTFIQPYKSTLYNVLDAFFFLCLSVSVTGNIAYAIAYIDDPQMVGVGIALIIIPICVHFLYIVAYLGYKLWTLCKPPLICIMCVLSRLLVILNHVYRKIGASDDETSPLVLQYH